jgi:acetyl-CoA carboxylase biotin carboxyl carrier protein
MRIEEIKELMSHMKATGLTNFEYEGQGVRVKFGVEENVVVASGPVSPVATPSISSEVTSQQETPVETLLSPSEVLGETVKSPIVGVFYEAPGPDKPVFVSVGDQVKKGEVLCIVEAMKVMNEIVADRDCKVTKILCANEDIVEYGQPLFEIEVL